jgi:hypothetical protein
MIPNEIREKIRDIVHGTRFTGTKDRRATVRNLLVESFGTGSTIKAGFESRAIVKEKQASFLYLQGMHSLPREEDLKCISPLTG